MRAASCRCTVEPVSSRVVSGTLAPALTNEFLQLMPHLARFCKACIACSAWRLSQEQIIGNKSFLAIIEIRINPMTSDEISVNLIKASHARHLCDSELPFRLRFTRKGITPVRVKASLTPTT